MLLIKRNNKFNESINEINKEGNRSKIKENNKIVIHFFNRKHYEQNNPNHNAHIINANKM